MSEKGEKALKIQISSGRDSRDTAAQGERTDAKDPGPHWGIEAFRITGGKTYEGEGGQTVPQ